MCGILGVVTPAGHGARADQLAHAAGAITHRGPDAHGVHTASVGRYDVGLAHRRLSILDHEGGAQPMLSQDQRVSVVFNGQVYNHAALRDELTAAGYAFVSDHSDTETLVHGYAAFGAGLPARLNGMFAFCALDAQKRRLLLARGPMGQKPLYVATAAFFGRAPADARPVLAFASELSALCALPGAQPEIDPAAVARFFAHDFVPAADAIYQGVHKLAPGTLLELDLERPIERPLRGACRYFPLPFHSVDVPRGRAAQDTLIRDTLESAITDRLAADVPVGLFLSGGIDSSLVAALARRHTDKLHTFSIGFTEKSFDESSHARLVADHLGCTHHERTLDADKMRDVLPAIADHLSEPFADHSVVPTYLLSQFAREHVTVALGGDGGDELFLGYPTFVAEKLRPGALSLAPGAVRSFATRARKLARRLPVSHDNFALDFKLQQFLGGLSETHPMRRHQAFLTGMTPASLAPLLGTASALHAEDPFAALERQSLTARADGARDVFDLLTAGYARNYLSEGVLQKVDRASMAVSLEARAPMMDKRFVALALSLPSGDKLRGLTTKAALKSAARGLIPDSIIDRPKKGFGMPVAAWFAGPLRGELEALTHESVLDDTLVNAAHVRSLVDAHVHKRANHRKTLWAVFMFQWWLTRVHPRLERASLEAPA